MIYFLSKCVCGHVGVGVCEWVCVCICMFLCVRIFFCVCVCMFYACMCVCVHGDLCLFQVYTKAQDSIPYDLRLGEGSRVEHVLDITPSARRRRRTYCIIEQ